MKFITRTVKVGNFTLKIIIKFCEQYSGYLGTCHQELFHMLLTVYRYVVTHEHSTFLLLCQCGQFTG